MLKTEYDILSYVQEHQDCTWIEFLNDFDPQIFVSHFMRHTAQKKSH